VPILLPKKNKAILPEILDIRQLTQQFEFPSIRGTFQCFDGGKTNFWAGVKLQN
jgi:hypothetical protein|tara:strand:+ start:634 stop:795 length:162 start_codon:yes stop_codon:yes gene_type:complete